MRIISAPTPRPPSFRIRARLYRRRKKARFNAILSFDFAQLPGSGVEESEDPISLRLSSGHEKARCRAVACYAFAQASLLAVEL